MAALLFSFIDLPLGCTLEFSGYCTQAARRGNNNSLKILFAIHYYAPS